MQFDRLIKVTSVFGTVAILFLMAMAIFSCIPSDFFSSQIETPQGDILKPGEGPNPPTYTIPSSGVDPIDAIVYTLAAAAYGAIGYYVRKTKRNGAVEASRLQAEITGLQEQLEQVQSSTRKPLTTSEIQALSRMLERDLEIVPKPES